jgi:hypothetical protein
MQAYQGYYGEGQFRTLDGSPVSEQGQAVLLFLEAASVKRQETAARVAVLDDIFKGVEAAKDEPMPEIERFNIARGAEL